MSSLFSMGDVDPRKLKKAAAEAAAQQVGWGVAALGGGVSCDVRRLG